MNKQQCVNIQWNAEIHYTGRHQCTRTVGPRGGVTEDVTRCRPSGKCQTWKTRPAEFRLPVKHGLYESAEINERNCQDFHLASECTLCSQPATVNA